MTKPTVFGLFGAGGYGREVMPWAVDSVRNSLGDLIQTYFVLDDPQSSVINQIETISRKDFISLNGLTKHFNVAIGDSRDRERIASDLMEHGLKPISLYSNASIIQSSSTIASGAIICPNVMIMANSEIGNFFQANIFSYVGHDCIIGNYVTFAPGVKCNGNVVIGDHAYLGAGAMIRQGTPDNPLTIGTGAIVGMGAVVTKDVKPYTTVIGNPARPV